MVPTVDANGLAIPAIGMGTWRLSGADGQRAVETALEVGYRHIDTAEIYGNEREVGAAIAASGIRRDELFVTTKAWHDHIGAGDLQRAAEASLERLGLAHADLYLIHWPNPDIPLGQSLEALADVKARGLARAVGVSNFPALLLEEAIRLSPVPLALNQVEMHPYLAQSAVMDVAHRNGLAVTAYCPIARNTVAEDPVVVAIAEAHGKTPAQVALRWLIQKGGVIAIPKSSHRKRLIENLDVFDFELTTGEAAAIDGLSRSDGRIVDPDFAPSWDR
ncbi:diketogulonate reductase-like aldo/keto reductase [Rhodobium orientis]|nr:diketogulonate reductase-like aldo/keto reductase [Rhodobium orientis]